MKKRYTNRNRIFRTILIMILGILFSGTFSEAVECVFKDPRFSFQCLRTMGYSSTGGADIGECLNTASRIKEKDRESWYKEWLKTSRQLEATANKFLEKRHKPSAKEAYFRASNYYRTAEFFLHTDPEVDPEKLVLVGFSFGGYLAPRAAAFEHRIKFCIADGGIYDFYENVMKKSPLNMEKVLNDKEASKKFDKEILDTMKTDVDTGWFFANGLFAFGAKSPSEFLKMLKPYNMKGIAEKIKCTMLVVDSTNDKDLSGQARQLFDALKCPKEYMLFTEKEGAEEHCQMGAMMISNERILNWLEEMLKKKIETR